MTTPDQLTPTNHKKAGPISYIFIGIIALCLVCVGLSVLGNLAKRAGLLPADTATPTVDTSVSAIQTAAVSTALAALPTNTDIPASPQSTPTEPPAVVVVPSDTPQPAAQFHTIGETISVKEITITLNSATITGNFVRANFTIENKSPKEIAVSSIMEFSAKSEDGTKLEQDIFDCGSSGLDGKVLPGDKLRGDICWKNLSAPPVKIYYSPFTLFSSDTVVWQITQ